MRRTLFAAIAATVLLAAPASAASYAFGLTGSVPSGSTVAFDSGGLHYTFFTIVLSGFGPTTFQVGDDITATVTLDQSLTVPSATIRNGVDFILLNTAFPRPTADTTTTGTTVLTDGGVASLSGGSTDLSQDQLVNSILNFDGSSFTFDTALSSFTVDSLGAASLTTDTALFRYLTVDAAAPAVPEPVSWGLMVLGLGGVGAALRRRRGSRPRFA